jgi:DNA (cytosine-5)-methyltransferase 1
MTLLFGDLFCGAGGMSCGFAAEGFGVLFGVDKEKQMIATFRRNHAGAEFVVKSDINKLNPDWYPKVDVLLGGPPCQSFSRGATVFDARKGLNDPRGNLVLVFARWVARLRPRVFVMENVPGIITVKGNVPDTLIDIFTKIGYNAAWCILCAQDFGVPQIRKRVFFLGYLAEFAGLSPSFPLPTHTEPVTVADALGDLPDPVLYPDPEINNVARELTDGEKDYLSRDPRHFQKHRPLTGGLPATTIPANLYKGVPYGLICPDWGVTEPSVDDVRRLSVREAARLQSFPDDYVFEGSLTSQYKQVGNAVPPLLAQAIAKEVKKCLQDQT